VKGILLDQTEGFSHPLHNTFRGSMWGIILKCENKSKDAALLDHCMKHQGKQIVSPELACEVLRPYEHMSSTQI
jgi:hypothetical protein